MKPRILGNTILVLLIFALAGGAAWILVRLKRGAQRREPPEVIPKVVVETAVPKRSYVVEIKGYGRARAHVDLTISPEVSGRVVYLAPNFESGMYVTKGQVLVKIDRTDYEQAERAARARIKSLDAQIKELDVQKGNHQELKALETTRVELAEDELKRIQKSVISQAASQKELDQARESLLLHQVALRLIENRIALISSNREKLEAELENAGVDLEKAETALERCTIASPFNGRVLSKKVRNREYVTAGADCGKIYGTDVLEVPVSVAAEEVDWLDTELLERYNDLQGRQGDKEPGHRDDVIAAKVHWPDSDRVWQGRVDRIEAGLEEQARTRTLVIKVFNPPRAGSEAEAGAKPNPDRTGRGSAPGSKMLDIKTLCHVTIYGRTLTNVFMLPRGSVHTVPDDRNGWPILRTIVYVVEDGRLAVLDVSVARFTDNYAVILPERGIKAGDRVVTSILAIPLPDMRVEPIEQSAAEPQERPSTAPANAAAGTE